MPNRSRDQIDAYARRRSAAATTAAPGTAPARATARPSAPSSRTCRRACARCRANSRSSFHGRRPGDCRDRRGVDRHPGPPHQTTNPHRAQSARGDGTPRRRAKPRLEAVAQASATSRAGLTDPRGRRRFPVRRPSGVGKTETALTWRSSSTARTKRTTIKWRSSRRAQIPADGQPPGYVGYGEGGVLTEAVRDAPTSVDVLDEMEKAHSGVQDGSTPSSTKAT